MFSLPFSLTSPNPTNVSKDVEKSDLLNDSSHPKLVSSPSSPLLPNSNCNCNLIESSDDPSTSNPPSSPSSSPSPSPSSSSTISFLSSLFSTSSSLHQFKATTTQSTSSISSSSHVTTTNQCSTSSSLSSLSCETRSSPYSDFTKFEEKRRNQAEKQSKTLTLRSILVNTAQRFGLRDRNSPTKFGTPETPNRSKGRTFLSIESFSLSYEDLYTSIGSVVPSWGNGSSTVANIDDGPLEDIQRQVNKLTDELGTMRAVDQMSAIVNNFYQSMIIRFETLPLFKEIVQVSANQLIDYTEIILLSRMWSLIFNQILAEDEEKDLQLQRQIRSLNWIMTDHLELDIDLTRPEIMDCMDKAIGSIIEMGSKSIPLQKLECIVNCSKELLQLLSYSRHGEPVSADLFLPALVYTLIQANPPLLLSNIEFIDKFSVPNRLISGEASYYFTNLCCAVAFIEKLNGESLNLSEEKFNRYTNGDERPNGSMDQLKSNSRLSDALRRLNYNSLFASLSSKQSILEDEIKQLKQVIIIQNKALLSQLQSVSDGSKSSNILQSENAPIKEIHKSKVNQGQNKPETGS